MANVSIGPHLVQNRKTGVVEPSVEHSGYSLELSGDEFAATIPIYRQIHDRRSSEIDLKDYLVEQKDLPFVVRCPPSFGLNSLSGSFVRLDHVLASLYSDHKTARSLFSILEELREHLPINSSMEKRREDGASLVRADIRDAGFEVKGIFSYGRTLTVGIVWAYPQDRQNPKCPVCVYAGSIDFKPT